VSHSAQRVFLSTRDAHKLNADRRRSSGLRQLVNSVFKMKLKPFYIGGKIFRSSRPYVSFTVVSPVDAALLCKTRKAPCLE